MKRSSGGRARAAAKRNDAFFSVFILYWCAILFGQITSFFIILNCMSYAGRQPTRPPTVCVSIIIIIIVITYNVDIYVVAKTIWFNVQISVSLFIFIILNDLIQHKTTDDCGEHQQRSFSRTINGSDTKEKRREKRKRRRKKTFRMNETRTVPVTQTRIHTHSLRHHFILGILYDFCVTLDHRIWFFLAPTRCLAWSVSPFRCRSWISLWEIIDKE